MGTKRKIAIIGAALFQEPAIAAAKEMGLETHVFAWAAGDPGEKTADFFYPISIREKDLILEECRRIGIDGIVSIASDLAMETVNYVAEEMGLPGNTTAATKISTNKHWMRKAFEENGDPSPRSMLVDAKTDFNSIDMEFPLIVKPTDRSGSRGVHKVYDRRKLRDAIIRAREYSFEDKAVVEEFVEGDEYSIEYISFRGQPLSEEMLNRVKAISEHALDTLGLENGAAHIELKIDGDRINIIEIGGRMGGDFIGSDLVKLSTGYDFVKGVIKVALGEDPEVPEIRPVAHSGVNFIISQKDVEAYEQFKADHPGIILKEHIDSDLSDIVTDSSNRHGYYIFRYTEI